MEQKRIRKVVITAAAVTGLTGGTVAFAAAYQAGHQYTPSGSAKELQANQVVFPGDEEKNNRTDDSGDNSELWEKDQQSDHSERPQTDKNSAYLFENGLLSNADAGSLSFADNGDNTPLVPDGTGSGTIYDVNGDGTGGDLIIGGNGTNGGTGQNNSNTNKTDNGKKEDPTPSPADGIKDPEPTKNNDEIPGVSSRPYTEDNIKNTGVKSVSIYDNLNSAYRLYKGQSVTGKELYYALNTYVVGNDGVAYTWGEDAYNEYVRVDGVSFDGGKTFVTQFPVTIPDNVDEGSMVIRVSYRLSTKSKKWTSQDVAYAPADSRIFVLSEKRAEDSDTIENILNLDSVNQCLDLGEKMNLYRWLNELVSKDDPYGYSELTELFPGWTENGQLVPWLYPATSGRHILEPGEKVALDSRFHARVKQYWADQNYRVRDDASSYLFYLQALTGYDEIISTQPDYTQLLEVPKYIQAIDIDGWPYPVTTNTIQVPDTVVYINGMCLGLQVNRAWKVDSNNEYYMADEAGMLYSKDQTELIGIPYYVTSLEIPDTLKRVEISYNNQISLLKLKADSVDEIPEITYQSLKNCRIVVTDEILDEFLEQNYQTLSSSTTVALSEDSDETFALKNQLIVSNYGKLRKALKGAALLKLPETITTIGEGAFSDAAGMTTLVLSDTLTDLTFEENCFAGSDIAHILCATEEQYDLVLAQKDKFGKEISVEYTRKSLEGYSYSQATMNGVTSTVLLDAPEDVKSFDGTLTEPDGTKLTVTSIGSSAFENCTELQWVMLPEQVKSIGYRAFYGCSSLEGVLIDSKDEITIGNESLDKCSSIRFVASNAMSAVMEDGYDPYIVNEYWAYEFFVPTGSTGYGWYTVSFMESVGVGGYIVKDYESGGKALYGVTADGTNTPWVLLRSGKQVDAVVKIPATVKELYSNSMTSTCAATEDGTYTVDWENAKALWAMGEQVFAHSGLSGKVHICGDITDVGNYYLGNSVFSDCKSLTEVQIDGPLYMGSNVFEQCDKLQKVSTGFLNNISNGTFNNCPSLEILEINSATPGTLSLYGEGFPFEFDWDPASKLHVKVPEGSELDYVLAWRNAFAGYADLSNQSAYQRMWDVSYSNLYNENKKAPTDEQVDEAVKTMVLNAENQARAFLQMDPVDEPTAFYPYRVDSEGMITLIGAPSDITEVVLSDNAIGLPTNWFIDYIGTGAFSKSKGLRNVTVPKALVGICHDAFAGVEFGEGEKLTLTFEHETPPELLGRGEDGTFSFGVADEHLAIRVPEGSEDDYLETWVYPLVGCENSAALQRIVGDQLAAEGKEATTEAISAEMARILTPVYNRLRAMMGLEPTTEEEVKAQILETIGGKAVEASLTETAKEANKAEEPAAETPSGTPEAGEPETEDPAGEPSETQPEEKEPEDHSGEAEEEYTEEEKPE